ncbi:GNAT family N-acetyltransferase [Emcibacter sp.]|uniref:GNAT family N-acetyltransferase n=1 Tax=Emcibacter sp. TaxID=1979954 RepID=UPI002AA7F72F|nr:GNAT family N-acetyltransferase [Emcibacter sp.]
MIRTIETERLTLRPFEPADAVQMSAIFSDWEVTRWLSTNVPFPFSEQDGLDMIRARDKDWAAGNGASYGAFDRETGEQVGGVRVFSFDEVSEVGYWLARSAWGKGFGTELLRAVVAGCFTHSPIREIVAQTSADNKGSQRILEKAGFIFEGQTPEEFARCGHEHGCGEFFRLKKEDWQKNG